MRFLFLLLYSASLLAFQGIAPERIPPELRPWQDWVLEGHRDALCPALVDNEALICDWPARLEIRVDRNGGAFSQDWQIFSDHWVQLPFSDGVWPQQVTVNGKPAVVVNQDDAPSILLSPGTSHLQGVWRWTKVPQTLQIPENIGLVALTIEGKVVRIPHRDESNQLWLNLDKGGEAGQVERLVVTIFRKFEDTIPMVDETRIDLEVGGQAREIALPNPLLEGFTPVSLESALPVRIDEQGQMIVQARPGTWQVRLRSRSASVPSELVQLARPAPWPEIEVWCFEAHPQLRAVSLEGLPGLDPTQTRMPNDWQKLPTFEAGVKASLSLVERDRGIGAGAPDSVSLYRDLWLDEQGGGFTFRDRLYGTLNRVWRVSMTQPYSPGRVVAGGEPRLITVLEPAGEAGVEVRQQQLELSVEGRLVRDGFDQPASGWNLTLNEQHTVLHLSPGWSLLAAFGADTVDGDWVHRWQLWDFFWVLVFAAGISRLYGKPIALLALVAMASLFHLVPMVPVYFAVLVLIALQRVTVGMRWHAAVGTLRWLAFALLLMGTFVFFKEQVIQAIYPQLDEALSRPVMHSVQAPEAAPVEEAFVAEGGSATRQDSAVKNMSEAYEMPKAASGRRVSGITELAMPKTELGKVQTGPGIPNWSGALVNLNWSSPLDPGQNLKLILIPPLVVSLWMFIRLGLLLWLLAHLAEVRALPKLGRKLGAAALLVPLLLLAPMRAQAQTPSKETLDELRELLLRKTDCNPNCAEIPWGALSDQRGELRLELEVHAVIATGVPLPGQPAEVLLDGRPATLINSEVGLYALAPQGVHRFTCIYPLDGGEALQWNFRLVPHRMDEALAEWQVSGIAPDGTCGNTLQLTPPASNQVKADGANSAINKVQFKPFFTVTRTVTLDRVWNMTSSVERHVEGAATCEFPLLPGENVISGERVVDGRILINMPAEVREVTWRSTVEPRALWHLETPTDANWTDVWQIQPSLLYHVTWEGTPAIEMFGAGPNWTPTWRPRPGESLDLTIVEPKPSEGQVLTFDSAQLSVSPGQRSSTVSLMLKSNSSLGGEHSIKLPDGIEITSQTLDGAPVQPRLEQGRLRLSLAPGEHSHVITWTTKQGLRAWMTAPAIDLGQPAVNITTSCELPPSRWLLWVSGPRTGPALLFWGMVLVLLLAAYLLARSGLTQLSFIQWFLLGLGISQLHVVACVIVVAWFAVVVWRARLQPQDLEKAWFLLVQLALLGLTVAFVVLLMSVLYTGLVGLPNNYLAHPTGSYATLELTWYQDRIAGPMPDILMVSLPFWVYRVLMLLWALWLARSVTAWVQMGWQAFSLHGLTWKPKPRPRRPRAQDGDQAPDQNGNATAPPPTAADEPVPQPASPASTQDPDQTSA